MCPPPPTHTHIKKKSKISRGYFGVCKIYKLFGFEIAYKIRTDKFEEFHLCFWEGKRIWKKRLPRKYVEAANLNCLNDSANLFEIQKIQKDKSCVLFLMDYLFLAGGVERRLELQFKWLEEHNVQPVIVARSQDYVQLDKYPFVRLIGYASNAQQKLLDLIRWTGAVCVEFNMKSTSFFHDVDLEAIKRHARVGCMIHGRVALDEEQLNRLDFRCTSSIHANDYTGVTFIPNIVEFPLQTADYNIYSKKALYIGRIDSEKLPTVENFVRLCREHRIEYEIAGPINRESKGVAEFCGTLDESVLIGPIDTRTFLLENGKEFAFIGGVGQVPLEAIAVNLPVVVLSHERNSNRAVFADSNNLADLIEWNCVITKLPEALVPNNSDEFLNAKRNAEKLGNSRLLDAYRVRDILMELRNVDKIYSEYLQILLGNTDRITEGNIR